jgi:hypothetical protein
MTREAIEPGATPECVDKHHFVFRCLRGKYIIGVATQRR